MNIYSGVSSVLYVSILTFLFLVLLYFYSGDLGIRGLAPVLALIAIGLNLYVYIRHLRYTQQKRQQDLELLKPVQPWDKEESEK